MHGVLGTRLKKAREELGLSQGALARALGFSSEFISLLEADKRAPSLATLNKIATYLKKDFAYFLQEKESAFSLLFRGAALPGSEELDPASRSIFQRFKKYCDDYLRLEHLANRAGLRRPFAPLTAPPAHWPPHPPFPASST